jgi:hypothetical protein
MDYRVTWEIDIEADTPEKAAELAAAIQRDKDSLANVFKVSDKDGNVTTIDRGKVRAFSNIDTAGLFQPCKFCGEDRNIEFMRLHDDGYVCEDCWDWTKIVV